MQGTSKIPDVEKARNLGKRIRQRIQELRDKGAFSDTRAAFLKDAEERCAEIDRKLESAVAEGGVLEAAALEFERDYDGLQLELARWIERHDENAMKSSSN